MRKHVPIILLLACLTLAFVVYYPGTAGYFTFDDSQNIINNTLIRAQSLDFISLKKAAYSSGAGMLGRPLSMISFALNYYFTGLNPYYFKLTNIVIHLLSGVCVFMLTILLLDTCRRRSLPTLSLDATRWISLAVAAAWLLHPLNLTGVLYIVQRMTSLAALFTLMGLIAYTHGRRTLMERKSGWIWIAASFLIFTPLATYSKENGALLPAFILLIELIFFRFESPSPTTKRLLIALFGITILLPFAALLVFIGAHPTWVTDGYVVRDFTLSERVMTEARIIWFYIRLILIPDIAQMGMYHDDIPISKGLLTPVSTIFALTGILALCMTALLSIRRHPIAAFGIMFFLIGHSIESSVLGLELVHEHRNYLPDYGILLALFYYLLYPVDHVKSLTLRRAFATAFILLLAVITFVRATQWGDPVLMKEKAVLYHPDSIRSNNDIGNFYAALPASSQTEAEDYYRRAYGYFAKSAELSPSDTLGLFGLIALNSYRGIPIEESWVKALAGRLKRYPLSPNTGISFANMQQCITVGNCKIPQESMELLIQTALQNPTLQGNTKAKVLFAWSDFLFNIKHDRTASAAAAYQAVAVNPGDLEFHNTLIHFLINMNLLEQAQKEILQARQLDKLQINTAMLDALEKRIAQIRNAQSKTESAKP